MMRKAKLDAYRTQLRDMARRLQGTAAGLEEATRMQTGGPDGGNLSSAPMHLGDIGTEVFTQELNATLLENEDYLRGEVNEALDRIDQGTFGTCESCGTAIPAGRLDILPYARYCVACAEKAEDAGAVNLNNGRPPRPGPALGRRIVIGNAPARGRAAVRRSGGSPVTRYFEGDDMDPLLIALIVVAVIAMSGWGYGYYARPAVPAGEMLAPAPAYASPLGIIGALAVVLLVAMLLTGWRPFVVVP